MQRRTGTPVAISGPWAQRFVALWAVFVALGAFVPAVQAEDLYESARELNAQYRAQLAELAAWCDERGLADEARQTREWGRAQDPNRLYVTVLPRAVGPPEPAPGASQPVVEWHERFWDLRRDQADAAYALARRAIRTHRASLAFDLVVATLHEDPDHKDIRELLGYQPYRGEWHTRYEVNRLRRGQVWHERFGWLPRTHVKRYERGERYYRGRWISAEDDARAHRHVARGWKVETEHYTVLTNHSIEAGVDLSQKLERLYRVWKQLFIRYYATDEQVAALFAGSARRPNLHQAPHSVVFFRDRDDYNRCLEPWFPNIEISIGVYAESKIPVLRSVLGRGRPGAAYFFAGDDYVERNLYHEGTHQLFHESRPVKRGVGAEGNFWIVEGVALYMESLREEDGYYVLGGFDDQRIHAARYRLLVDDFYVPLSALVTYGMLDFQHDERVATLYSQAAGLTNFFVHYEGGRYRDALVNYLAAVYSRADTPNTLAQLTGSSLDELDRQYREYMQAAPEPSADVP